MVLSGFMLIELIVIGIQAYVFMLIVLYTLREGFYSPWVRIFRVW